MDSNRERMRDIFDQARRLPKAERAAFLNGLAAVDGPMRSQIEDMLAALDEAGAFLSEPTHGAAGDAAATIDAPIREGPGTRIGPYKLLQQIGEGGFGSVFMAEQEKPVARKVALKIIKLGMDTRQVVARFEQERQALALMDHPNIAKVLDAGATETGRPYFVMELCKGDPIVDYCDKNNLSVQDRLELFAQVCLAVQHAHTKGIIHRDIKPSNILVSTQDGRPHTKVIDFGIAKATASKLTEKTLFTEHRQLIGTPEYMSPEQAEGSLDIDTRTDVYSLGVLLYELLTGTTPFSGQDLRSAAYAEIQRIIREVEPPKPSTRISQNTDTIAGVAAKRHTEPKRLGTTVRGELDWIVMKALEKDRQRRYETANGLAMDIRRYLSGEAVVAAPPSTAYRFKKFVRRNRVMVTAGSAVAAALLIGAIAFAWQASVAREQRDIAVKAQKAEASAKIQAQDHERKAVAEAERAKTITEFVTTALRSADAMNAGGGQEVTVLAAMSRAIEDIDSGRFANDPQTEAELQSTIAKVLLNNGRLQEAGRLFTKALSNWRSLASGDEVHVAAALSDIASVKLSLGRLKEAEPLFVEALEMEKRLFPGDHKAVATCMSNLATVMGHQGRFAEAEPLYVESLEMDRRLFPGDHVRVATGMDTLANIRNALGRPAEAEALMTQSVEMYRRLYKDGHPDLAIALVNLASARRAIGRLAEAEPLCVEALEMCKRLYRGDHPSTVASLFSLARVRSELGRPTEAEPMLAEALAMSQRVYKADHPQTASILLAIARCLSDTGRHSEALQRAQAAKEMVARVLPEGHPLARQCNETLNSITQQASPPPRP